MRLTDYFENVGRWYPYSPRLAICLGGVNRAVFVLNLLSRMEQTEDDRGVYKTQEEIQEETGLSIAEQVGARKHLKIAGILLEQYARLEHKLFYKIDKDRLNDLWDEFSRNVKSAIRETAKQRFDETAKSLFGKHENSDSSYRQENTSNRIPKEHKHKQDIWPSPSLLIELYNKEACDDYPSVEKITEGRLKKARSYLKQFPDKPFWLEVFKEMNRSDFLRGRIKSNGHESFQANFDWLLTKGRDGTENVVKVYEGKYRNGNK